MRMHVARMAAATVVLSACGVSPEPAVQGASSPTTRAPRTYNERHDAALQQCIQEKGWKIRVRPEGGFEVTTPPEQQQRYDSDQDECVKQFEQKYPPPKLTASDYTDLYRQELATMRCLEKAGYPRTGTPVSEQQYVDEYTSGKAPSWYAYSAVGNVSGDAFAEVEKKCPQPDVDK